MRNWVILAVIAGLGLANGLGPASLPGWRVLAFVALAFAAYLHGRRLSLRHGWPVFVAVVVADVAIAASDPWAGVTALGLVGLFVALPWLVGRSRRQQIELIDAGRQRVLQLEREKEFVAESARLRERARIAADMHDSLGHELALIALRAGALELADDASEVRREAAARLRASAVTATDRLRQTIGMLHEQGGSAVEPPDESVELLVERARGAGMGVSLTHRGDGAALPPLVDRAVHRVVQEALTNAARYAPGADVGVDIEEAEDAVTVVVTNSAGEAAPFASGAGTGLLGLRERVGLLGGTVRAGATGDGFAVTVRVPVRSVPAAEGDT